MKKCPYCFELVQEDALKCKHCNEWFNKENHLKKGVKNLFNSVSNKIDTMKEERNRKKTAHLFIPTDEEPMIFEGITFYGNRFKTDKEEIFYYQITNIDFCPSSSTLNYSTNHTLRFGFYYIDIESASKVITSDAEPKLILVTDDSMDVASAIIKKINITKKQLEQLNFVKNFISKLTYELRVLRYAHSISSYGYIKYCHIGGFQHKTKDIYKFHSNGNVEYNNVIITNLLKDYNKEDMLEMIVFGTNYRGYKSSSSNPFELVLKNKNAKWYDILNKKVIIKTSIDKDIFPLFMVEFIKTGKFPTKQVSDSENKMES